MSKTIFQKKNELILQDYPEFPGLIDLGFCTIHTVHNALGKGMVTGVSTTCMYMMLDTKEKAVTKVTFEFSNNLIPPFEQFVLLFQQSAPSGSCAV